MIRSFRDRLTEDVFDRHPVRRLSSNLQRAAQRKLTMLNAAEALSDLRSPPGNRLEALGGNRSGQHSIRINDQYCICFKWRNGEVWEVEIVDYHG